ncbi:MAG: uracil-DNA glycosylase [Bacteroidales bacterium]|jgi:uracil-DNA glycosylase|nr:uracil-DNA glycosylase [Bacteroidales bacterium]MDD4383632.1 uracil-DNA glycosylase [Bacteroidales bacterium]MDY0197286.1 uracil-DNA glycosylase [Tenuifilaceae bacterium]
MEHVTLNPAIEQSWKEVLKDEFNKEYFSKLKEFLVEEKKQSIVYPPGNLIFNAFNHTPFNQVKIVMLGQDPYHGPNQAHGLCFSVPKGVAVPPSLVNIFKEINSDLGLPIPLHGNLEKWAKQGVLLLNATLTVRAHQAGSHQKRGWEQFTDAAIVKLSEQRQNIIFMLWGAYAQAKANLIDNQKHHILMAPHPSPLSAHRGFFGCKHFSKANKTLNDNAMGGIEWSID